MKILLVNPKETYQGKVAKLRETLAAAGQESDLLENTEGVIERYRSGGYAAIMHRNEHGRLFADGSLGWVREAVSARIPVLSFDFGYFDHYKTIAFDFYRADLSSSIHEEWGGLCDKVKWQKAPAYVREYRSDMLAKVACSDPSRYMGKVGVWMQWNTNLLRPELGVMRQWEWINRVCAKVRELGLEPVVKMSAVNHSEIFRETVPRIEPWIRLVCDQGKVEESNNGRAVFDRHANWHLLAGCSYHIINCTSASNLMVLCKRPVIATGASWFNALGVFGEPVTWEHPLHRPPVDPAARAKWVNWWLSRQVPWEPSEQVAQQLGLMVKQAVAYHEARP